MEKWVIKKADHVADIWQAIVVTGAGAGFGRGIVKKLVAEGAKVLFLTSFLGTTNTYL